MLHGGVTASVADAAVGIARYHRFRGTRRFTTVELKVTDTEPSIKGATANALYKPATLETGLKTSVPPFVSIGETIVVDTRTGEYLSRAK